MVQSITSGGGGITKTLGITVNTPVTDDADQTTGSDKTYYVFFTMPTDEKFYRVTSIKWKNGATVSGTLVVCGLDEIVVNPPTSDDRTHMNAAQSGQGQQMGLANTTQETNYVISRVIAGGQPVAAWIAHQATNVTFRKATITSAPHTKTIGLAGNYPFTNEAAWDIANTVGAYLEVICEGWS